MSLLDNEKCIFPSDIVKEIMSRHGVVLSDLSWQTLIDNLTQEKPSQVKMVRDVAFAWKKGMFAKEEVVAQLVQLLDLPAETALKMAEDIEKEVFPLFPERPVDVPKNQNRIMERSTQSQNFYKDDSYREPVE